MSAVFEDGQHLRLAPGVRLALDDLREQASRASGPGGQSVNKLSSAVELWAPVEAFEGLDDGARARLRKLAGSKLTKADEVHLRTETARSQRDNRQTNREKLGELIARALHKPKARRKTKPSRGAVRRRLEAKKQVGEKKARRGRVRNDE